MPRIVGNDIPNDKHIWVSLTYITGIGRGSAFDILKEADIDPQTNAGEMTEDQLSRITQIIDDKYVIEGQLRRQKAQDISRLREINCYRGIRHRKGLPVRGQRTRTNARTRKGPKKTVAGKKGVKEAR